MKKNVKTSSSIFSAETLSSMEMSEIFGGSDLTFNNGCLNGKCLNTTCHNIDCINTICSNRECTHTDGELCTTPTPNASNCDSCGN
jgi:hypothetical protein